MSTALLLVLKGWASFSLTLSLHLESQIVITTMLSWPDLKSPGMQFYVPKQESLARQSDYNVSKYYNRIVMIVALPRSCLVNAGTGASSSWLAICEQVRQPVWRRVSHLLRGTHERESREGDLYTIFSNTRSKWRYFFRYFSYDWDLWVW